MCLTLKRPAAHFGTVPSINRQWGLGNELWQDLMVVHMGGLGGTIMLQSVDGKGTRINALQATQWCIITDDGLVQPKDFEGFVRCSYYTSKFVFFFFPAIILDTIY